MHIALFTARHAQTLVFFIPCTHSYIILHCGNDWYPCKKGKKQVEIQNARHWTGAGGFSRGRDVPARMCVSISKRNISVSMHVSHVHPALRKEENTAPFNPRVVLTSLVLQRIPREPGPAACEVGM